MKKKSHNTISINYKSIGKKTSLLKELTEVIPKQFKPTKKTSSIFTTIIVIVIGIGVINAILPIMDLSFDMSTEEAREFKLDIKVGLPLEFFGNGGEDEKIKMSAPNLIIDLLLYILTSYILDVIINFIFSLKIAPTATELKRKPKVVKFQKKGATEKAVEKVAQKIIEKTPQQATPTQLNTQTTQQNTLPTQNPKIQPIPKI